MAILHDILEVSGETAGFLLPVFREFIGANHELIQRVDKEGNVISFGPILIDSHKPTLQQSSMEVRVGGPAIWVFRDHGLQVHIGTASEIEILGLRLLRTRSLSKFPMAAAEMAAFCNVEENFPNVMTAAFKALSKLSEYGAETWRDSVVLLPHIKRDIADYGRYPNAALKYVDDIFAISRANMMHVYVPEQFALSEVGPLPSSHRMAKIFEISNFHIHRAKSMQARHAPMPPRWSLFGIGGIAHFVISRPPFRKQVERKSPISGVEVVHGQLNPQIDKNLINEDIAIAIVRSDRQTALMLHGYSLSAFSSNAPKHALVVRPIGFGTPRKDKTSITEIREILNNFDYFWILANHRQRQTGRYANSLSASNAASRFVKAAAEGLIDSVGGRSGRNFLLETANKRSFGLFGSVRYVSISMHEVIRRLLHSMICEDALLHTASRIVVLWPYRVDDSDARLSIRLGAHEYIVDLIARPTKKLNTQVVAFATDVQLARRNAQEFRDFCVSLVAGYGWNVRHETEQSLLLENEGATTRIWPVVSSNAATELLGGRGEYGRDGDLIVTNQSISASLKSLAEVQDWGLAHYSELGRWMNAEYHVGTPRDF
jgi:hypothetical protein